MRLYDTLSREVREFKPLRDNIVLMYTCGLTPYDYPHIGHARTYVSYDVLKRYLIFKGYEVIHIQNITDIDDKLIKRAKETNRDPLELAQHFHDIALKNFEALNILPADAYPKVSEHLKEIEEIVKTLMDKGIAYKTSTGIYFDVTKFPEYGKLSGQSLEEISKHRIEPDPTKKHPADFALWKYSEDYKWPSPLGEGRPGWHIECSAMSLKYSNGETLDIHGGARDLIFPHHENEIAQSECYTGKKFANFWVHTGFLTVDGVKMSKSLGNFVTIEEALKKHHPMALRMLFISAKYSSPIDYSEEKLHQAYENYLKLKRAYEKLYNLKLIYKKDKGNYEKVKRARELFLEALEDDLDTPRALAQLFEVSSWILGKEEIDFFTQRMLLKFFREAMFILGLTLESNYRELLDKVVKETLKVREEFRKQKQYELSDKLRDVLQSSGIEVMDSKEGSSYVVKE